MCCSVMGRPRAGEPLGLSHSPGRPVARSPGCGSIGGGRQAQREPPQRRGVPRRASLLLRRFAQSDEALRPCAPRRRRRHVRSPGSPAAQGQMGQSRHTRSDCRSGNTTRRPGAGAGRLPCARHGESQKARRVTCGRRCGFARSAGPRGASWAAVTNPPPWWARRRARALRRAATRAPHRVWPGGRVDQAALSPSTVEHVLGSSSQAFTRLVRAHPCGRRFACPRSDFSRALACGAACAAGPASARPRHRAKPHPRQRHRGSAVIHRRHACHRETQGPQDPFRHRRQRGTSVPADRLGPGGLQACRLRTDRA
jgi:hypothetical protein